MKQSRAALEALAGRSDGDAAMLEWDSMSMASSEGGALATADSQKPAMEIRASLGEFAILVSGRVSDDWWPADGDGVRIWTDLLPCMQGSCFLSELLAPSHNSSSHHGFVDILWLPLLLQASLTGIPEEQRPIVNVDGERPLAVVRASGAKSDISISSQHFGVSVAIGTGVTDLL